MVCAYWIGLILNLMRLQCWCLWNLLQMKFVLRQQNSFGGSLQDGMVQLELPVRKEQKGSPEDPFCSLRTNRREYLYHRYCLVFYSNDESAEFTMQRLLNVDLNLQHSCNHWCVVSTHKMTLCGWEWFLDTMFALVSTWQKQDSSVRVRWTFFVCFHFDFVTGTWMKEG